jgi:hypothetical protein
LRNYYELTQTSIRVLLPSSIGPKYSSYIMNQSNLRFWDDSVEFESTHYTRLTKQPQNNSEIDALHQSLNNEFLNKTPFWMIRLRFFIDSPRKGFIEAAADDALYPDGWFLSTYSFESQYHEIFKGWGLVLSRDCF